MATVTLASEKQIAFIQKLQGERDWSSLNVKNIEAAVNLTSIQASALISLLLTCPYIKKPVTVEPGFYSLDGTVYRVVKAKSTGNLYAKKLTLGESKGHWDYAPGAMKNLARAEVLTLEAAKSMGHAHGICVICGAELTDPDSVERGIGPVCAAKI